MTTTLKLGWDNKHSQILQLHTLTKPFLSIMISIISTISIISNCYCSFFAYIFIYLLNSAGMVTTTKWPMTKSILFFCLQSNVSNSIPFLKYLDTITTTKKGQKLRRNQFMTKIDVQLSISNNIYTIYCILICYLLLMCDKTPLY